MLLAATVGLPYFVLSTTSPLLQVWFSRSYPGRSPYRLYALSNFGSLAALLSYPFVFEPAFELNRQSWLWSGAFAVYAIVCGASAVWLWRCGKRLPLPSEPNPIGDVNAAAVGVSWLRRALWVFLPACASLMLLATTNHVCQDVAVVPFLWVVPLSLYLLSFIICFDHQRWYVRSLWAILAVAAIMAVGGTDNILAGLDRIVVALGIRSTSDISLDYVQELVLYFSAMFFICMVCHGELVKLRPDPRHLTEYYLCISAGGALGGVFVSLVAPVIFTTFFEWRLGLALSYIVAFVAVALAVRRHAIALFSTAAVAVAGLALLISFQSGSDSQSGVNQKKHYSWSRDVLERGRNFYGVVTVFEYKSKDETSETHQIFMRHGAIKHGEQNVAPDDPKKRQIPLTYYGYTSGVGRVMEYLQKERSAMRVGVVGLGVGTMAGYARPNDDYRIYEINPIVSRFSDEGGYFTYLTDARQRGAKVEVILGDGRLSLERESPQKFDLLVLDAFSGDSIPAHLLTREAMEIYRKLMAPGGVIAVHITNSYLYLAPVVRGLAKEARLGSTRIYTARDNDQDLLRNDWMLLTEDEKLLAAFPAEPPKGEKDDFEIPLWTDHYNNLFKILK
jgi:hypothetical protein